MTDPDGDVRVEGRPAPEYGEYAPPGWVSPVAPAPVDEQRAQDPAARQQSDARPAPPEARQRFDAPPPTGSPVAGPPPRALRRAAFNRFATVLLAVLGGYDVVSSAFDAKTFTGRYVSEFTRLGYLSGTFQSTAILDTVALVAAIVSVPVFLIALVVALRRLRVGKRSWLVLLLPGVIVNLALGLVVVAIVMGDPSFTGAV
ncbi:DUF6264 family protein [Frondihabitans sp. Leaf304]|uniref:DUF6264 family protein n=1 Tax=Frondihabitans sp. Leaf304 TaxID=1736329 RepID=UPI0006F1D449|nr:DUF6264 family protein [Frondihabitans sp. Leaf304]KQQ26699.1 hypothetical protein ASF54_12060 [Frondihabitans sp. Leaf304]